MSEVLSDQKLGPYVYFQSDEYRVEEFFLSRPITIFEMRNEIFMNAFGKLICDFNNNEVLSKKIAEYKPKNELYIDENL
jgi:hypothetical protein